MEFLALDVETANADMASICQIGIARFEGGRIAGEWKSYINPQCRFDGIYIAIHGIDTGVVANAPTFAQAVSDIESALNGRIVVTHTAFDRVAIHQAGAKCKSIPPTCTWLDSAQVVRRAWPEFSKKGYGLQNVCDSIGYKFQAHDALEDAKAAGNIVLAAIARTGLRRLPFLNFERSQIASPSSYRSISTVQPSSLSVTRWTP